MVKEHRKPARALPKEDESPDSPDVTDTDDAKEVETGVKVAPPIPIASPKTPEVGKEIGKESLEDYSDAPRSPLLAARKLRQSLVLPEVPGSKVSWEQACKWMALLTPDHWERLVVYVYRVYPNIIRQLADKDSDNYIDKLGAPFTEQHFIDNHGGGKYKLVFSDTTKGKDNTGVMEVFIEISMSQYRPKLNYHEVDLSHRDNKMYVKALRMEGIIDEHGNVVERRVMAEKQQAMQPVTDQLSGKIADRLLSMFERLTESQKDEARKVASADPVLSQVVTMLSNQNDKNLEMMIEKTKGEGKGGDAIAGIMEKFMGLVTTILTARKGDGDGISMAQVLTMMQQSQDKQMELMRLLFTSKSEASGGGEGGKYSDLREMILLLRELKEETSSDGDGGGGIGSNRKRTTMEILMEHGMPVLNNLVILGSNALAARAEGKGATVTRIDTSGLRGVPTHMQNAPEQVDKPGNSVVASLPPAPEHSDAPPPPANLSPGQIDPQTIIRGYGGLILAALNAGQDGYEFCEHVIGLFGMATHAIAARFGVDALVQAAKAVPEFWNQAGAFGEDKLRMFIAEFIEYPALPPEEDEDGQVDPPEPVLVTGKGDKGKGKGGR